MYSCIYVVYTISLQNKRPRMESFTTADLLELLDDVDNLDILLPDVNNVQEDVSAVRIALRRSIDAVLRA